LHCKLRGGKSTANIIMFELQTVLNGSDRDRHRPLQIRKTTGLIQAPNHTEKGAPFSIWIKFENPLHS
jgi:hypothetical protein